MAKYSQRQFTLKEAAAQVGVAPITLKRWLLDGKVAEVARNRNDWRIFTEADVERIREFASAVREPK